MIPLRLSSLHGKIFMLVVSVLLGLAATMMLVTQFTVTRSMAASERHAINNVMELLRRDLDIRWAALLSEKIEIVGGGKQQLRHMGQTLLGVIAGYADLASRGVVGDGAARGLARAWINQHSPRGAYDIYVYDEKQQVLAANRRDLIDRDLSGLTDIKGGPLNAAAADAAFARPPEFALYHWPGSGQRDEDARYAYFAYFPHWNWVLVIDDSARTVLERAALRRQQMEQSLRDTLARLTLARSGFVMILDEQGRPVVPPPSRLAGMLDTVDLATNRSLATLLKTSTPDGSPSSVPFSNNAGAWLVERSHFAPLKWTLVGVVPQADLAAPAQRILQRQALILAATLVLALALAWLLAARLARPLHQLARYALDFSRQDLSRPSPPPAEIRNLSLQCRDETGRLAASFLQMADRLTLNVRRLLEQTSARERMENELLIARDIQLGLLPLPLPDAIRGRVDLHALMVPAKEVGGDLYDYFAMRDGGLCIAIGDVSDKGIPAALFMAVTRTLIRTVAEDENDPAQIVAKVNDKLAENNPRLMFVTLMLATIDPASRLVRWVSAGHPPSIHCASGTRAWALSGRSGPACGIQGGLQYRSFSTQLRAGDVLLGYTDGVTEAMAPDAGQYGESRLFECLERLGQVDCAPLLDGILADVKAHAAGAEQSDDITLIAVRIP